MLFRPAVRPANPSLEFQASQLTCFFLLSLFGERARAGERVKPPRPAATAAPPLMLPLCLVKARNENGQRVQRGWRVRKRRADKCGSRANSTTFLDFKTICSDEVSSRCHFSTYSSTLSRVGRACSTIVPASAGQCGHIVRSFPSVRPSVRPATQY